MTRERLPLEITDQIFAANDLQDHLWKVAAMRMGECQPPLGVHNEAIGSVAFSPLERIVPLNKVSASVFVGEASQRWAVHRTLDPSPQSVYDYGNAGHEYASPFQHHERFTLECLVAESVHAMRGGVAKLACETGIAAQDVQYGVQARALNELAFVASVPRLFAAHDYIKAIMPALKSLKARGFEISSHADEVIPGPMQITPREFLDAAKWRLPTPDFFSLVPWSAKYISDLILAETIYLAYRAHEVDDTTWLMRQEGAPDLRPSIINAPSGVVDYCMENTAPESRPVVWGRFREGAGYFAGPAMTQRYRRINGQDLWRMRQVTSAPPATLST